MENKSPEDDPRLQAIFENIDAEVESILAHKGCTRKMIGEEWPQLFWSAKERVLKEKYNLDWTPSAD